MEFEFNTNNLPDLGSASIEDKELNQYLGYPNPEEMLNHIALADDDTFEINLEELSVNGRIVKDEMETYLKTKAVSNSACKEALKTPLHFFYYVNQTIPRESKSHFDLGTFAHMAFLEPELFDKVKVEPSASRASKAGVNDLIKFYEGLNEVTPQDVSSCKLEEMKDYLQELENSCKYQIIDDKHKIIIDVLKSNYYRYGNGIIPKILKGAVSEASFYTEDPITGIPLKIRPDAINTIENIGVDVIISFKTTTSDNIQKFVYDTAKYSYELGEGMYQEVAGHITGRKFKTTIMIMLQTVPPYLPAVFWWDADDLENGKYKFRNALQTIKEATDKSLFPGFDAMAESGLSGIIRMKQPAWSMKELHPVDIDE